MNRRTGSVASGWMVVLAASLALPLTLSHCSKSRSMEELFQASDAVGAAVKQEVGHEGLVTYNQDGSDVHVTVALQGASDAKVEQVKARVEAIVRRHYPEATEIEVKGAAP